MSDGQGSPEARRLFELTARALACCRLRMKPRERQLALALAVESFGNGAAAGAWDVKWVWSRYLKPDWYLCQCREMLDDWVRHGWIAVDVAVGEFRLAPDRWPGWAECFSEPSRDGRLELDGGPNLASMCAAVSQELAARAGPRFLDQSKIIGPVSKDFGVGSASVQNVKTFNRSNVSTIKRSGNVDANGSEASEVLRERVRKFVGQADWESELFWNSGRGWRGNLFAEEAEALGRALDYVEGGLRSGEAVLRKTRGAMLWDQFQRERHKV